MTAFQVRCEDKLWQGPKGKHVGWGPRAKFIWLPSKELLISVPLLVLSYHTLHSHRTLVPGVGPLWRFVRYADLVAPVTPFMIVIVALLVFNTASMVACRCWRPRATIGEEGGVTPAPSAPRNMPSDVRLYT